MDEKTYSKLVELVDRLEACVDKACEQLEQLEAEEDGSQEPTILKLS